MTPFTPAATAWFAAISQSNTKETFASLKPAYEAEVRRPFSELLQALAAQFGGEPYVFRPNRDVRFSTDKRPYKTAVSGYLKGRERTYGGTYAEFSLDGLFAAAGYHELAADQLSRYRGALTGPRAEDLGRELRDSIGALEAGGYAVGGERLKTAPRGVAKDDPNLDLLRFKSLTASARLPLERTFEPSGPFKFVAAAWRAAAPLTGWFDDHVGPAAEAARR